MKDGEIVQIGTPEEILIKPADPYVERFVEDVDLSKVLTAAHIMRKPETITPDRGPRVALQLMRDSGVSSLYVVGREKKLLGVITAEAASHALDSHRNVEEIMQTEVPAVKPDTLLNELFHMMAETKIPLAVVDDDGKLKGIIIKGAVLSALAGNANLEEGAAV
jgi:glycine betaine/proline transport system ATP-binding protein